ncbi:MAG: nucleotidyltransferase domain-containing protein [Mariprofundales bacterium]
MRLDAQQKSALFKAIRGLSPVYLFGSRTDDAARGGDIDLLLYSHEPAFALSRRVARDFFLECEEKIDVVVVNPDAITPEQQALINSACLERIQ